MIEAPELVTPTQRKLHDRYTDIHRKFFPSPPVFSRPQPKIIDPPGDQQFTFCGQPVREGSPYCDAHHRLCYIRSNRA